MANALIDFDAYVDVRFHQHKRLKLVLALLVENRLQRDYDAHIF